MPTMQNLSAKNLVQLCQQGMAVMLMLSLAVSSWADLDTIIIDRCAGADQRYANAGPQARPGVARIVNHRCESAADRI